MALNVNQGSVTTYDSKALQSYIDPKVILAYAKEAPFVGYLKKKGVKRIGSTTAERIVKDFGKPTTTSVATDTTNLITPSTSTTIKVAAGDGKMFVENSIIFVPSTGEQILVVGVTGDDLTVVRGYGETAAADIADGALLVYLGTAYSEATRVGTTRNVIAYKSTNVTQIFRTPVEISGTDEAVDAVDADWALEKKEKLIMHLGEIERQFMFGDFKDDTSAERRTARGLHKFIKTNVYDLGAAITAKKMADFVLDTVRANSGKKVLFASADLFTAIEDLAQQVLRVQPGSKKFGATVAKWLIGGKEIDIVHDPVLDEAGFAGYGYLVDMKNVDYITLRGRDTRFKEYADDDFDGRRGEYLTEATLLVGDEKTMGIVFNP